MEIFRSGLQEESGGGEITKTGANRPLQRDDAERVA